MGHVRMMAAVQPFISGAISKTINTAESTAPCGASCPMSASPGRTNSPSAATKATSQWGLYEDGAPGEI
jgi:ribonucleotide reductase alpha subunit